MGLRHFDSIGILGFRQFRSSGFRSEVGLASSIPFYYTPGSYGAQLVVVMSSGFYHWLGSEQMDCVPK